MDDSARELRRGVWFGGRPARVLRLSAAATEAMDRLRCAPVATRVDGLVARRLTDAGLAHPVPPPLTGTPAVTVVVPVKDRLDALERCLASLGATFPVIVVDDASDDELGVRSVATRHGATVVRQPVNTGPGPARGAGLARVTTELVAFVDSDTEPGIAWISELSAHFADPAVSAVAPRIVPRSGNTCAGRYTSARGSLDLGMTSSRVVPYTLVSYVPTAALLARPAALHDVARDDNVFDPALRVGEDVDLVWRLHAAGHRVRYEPSATVPHDEPATLRGLLARRFSYGTSAAPLALRHPGNVAPLVVHPWFTAAVLAALARRPVPAVTLAGVAAARTRRALRRANLPTDDVLRLTAGGLSQTAQGLARWSVQFGWPLLGAGLVRGNRGTRFAAAALLLTPPVAAWRHRRADVDPLRFVPTALLDDLCYGAGVLAGCARHRTTVPLRPVRAH